MIAEELELEESGQLSIGVAGERRSLEGLAAPGKPAPITFERDHEPDELSTLDDDGYFVARVQYVEESDEPPAPKPTSKRTYTCGVCAKTLKDERWIYSQHTGQRYCWPGECRTDRKTKKEG